MFPKASGLGNNAAYGMHFKGKHAENYFKVLTEEPYLTPEDVAEFQ